MKLADLADLPAAPRPCSIAAALRVVGERWSLLAIRELGYGVNTFDRIAKFTGASRDILTDRLRKLEAEGVVERRRYSEHPPRYEYHLTEAGRALFPVLLSLQQWGDAWAIDTSAARFGHDCGHPLDVETVCKHCGSPVAADSVRVSRS
jgi:DNA-binding HxlR family transcriptional regulator